jgi:hypothetical protein
MDQKTYCGQSVNANDAWKIKDRYYPVVDVCSGVQDFRPEETLAKGVSNRLALPNYESTVKPKCLGEREIHTLFQEQSPQWSSTA